MQMSANVKRFLKAVLVNDESQKETNANTYWKRKFLLLNGVFELTIKPQGNVDVGLTKKQLEIRQKRKHGTTKCREGYTYNLGSEMSLNYLKMTQQVLLMINVLWYKTGIKARNYVK